VESATVPQVIVNAKVQSLPSGEPVSVVKTKRVTRPRDPNAPARKSAYNDYMKVYLAKAKLEVMATLPEGQKPDHKLLFKQVASQWKNSAEKRADDAAKLAKSANKASA